MSKRGCCMVGCTVTQGRCRGLSFHSLPRQGVNEQWRKDLIQQINRSDRFFNPDKACICSRHFEESCFRSTKQRYRRLIHGSLPTRWMPQKFRETPKAKARKLLARPSEMSEVSLPEMSSNPLRNEEHLLNMGKKCDEKTPLDSKPQHQPEDDLCVEINLLAALQHYQQTGHLCDATVVASDGREFKAHAGVLAAVSSLLTRELSECNRGNYTISLPLNGIETEKFIQFAYTGQRNESDLHEFTKLDILCDQFDTSTHAKNIITNLDDFAEKGLFCDMAWCDATGKVEPTHSYIMAAKYDFISRHIKTGSIVYVTVSGERSTDVASFEQCFPGTSDHDSSNITSTSGIMQDYFVIPPDLLHDDFSSVRYPNVHTRHTRYQCKTCEKSFRYNCRLHQHERIHTGEKPYVCDICWKKFKTSSQLKQHKPVHTDDKTHICDICQKGFTLKGNMIKHKLIHTGDKHFECEVCLKSFGTNGGLKQHATLHTGGNIFTCDICQKGFTLKCNMIKHRHLHINDKSFKCDTCKKSFRQGPSLRQHEAYKCDTCGKCLQSKRNWEQHECSFSIRDNNDDNNDDIIDEIKRKETNDTRRMDDLRIRTIFPKKKMYMCGYCGKYLTSKYNLKQHELNHSDDKPYTCSTCQKRYRRKQELEIHEYNHSGVKPYACSSCDKSFRAKRSLIEHERDHTANKPYTCTTCHKAFRTNYLLVKHKRGHAAERPYMCTTCNKCFKTLRNLNEHELVHSVDKPYKCSTCNKCFRRRNDMKLHEYIHTSDKPHSCAVCHKCFSTISRLTMHERTHTGQKPYTCGTCQKSFAQRSSLNKHESIHTGLKPYECEKCSKQFGLKSNLAKHSKRVSCVYK